MRPLLSMLNLQPSGGASAEAGVTNQAGSPATGHRRRLRATGQCDLGLFPRRGHALRSGHRAGLSLLTGRSARQGCQLQGCRLQGWVQLQG